MEEHARILIVDDDAHIVRARATLLERAGHEVLRAHSWEEGLRLARDARPDLILLGLQLQDDGSSGFCRAIRTSPDLDHPPLIILSSSTPGSSQEAEALEAGADGTIGHSITNRELLTQIDPFLRIQRAERELQASEARYRDLFDNAPIGIYRTTPDGDILMANPALVDMLGYDSFEELAERSLESEGYHPDYPRARFKARMEAEGRVDGLEAAWSRKDGSTLFVRENAQPVHDACGHLIAYQGTAEDVTERVHRMERLDRLNTVLDTIGEVDQLIVRERDRDRLIAAVCERLVQTHCYQGARITLVGDDGEPVHFDETGLRERRATEADGPEETVLGLSLGDALSRPGVFVSDAAEVCWAERLMAARLHHVGSIYGLLCVSLARTIEVDEREKALFQEVAGDIAFALHNIELQDEHRQVDRALVESERRQSLVLSATTEHCVYHNTELEIQWANRAAAESVGLRQEDLVGRHCYEIWGQRQEPCEGCPVLLARELGEPQATEQTTPDGRVWFVRGYPVFDEDGEVEGLVEFTQEITEARAAQQALRESEERYRTLFESAPEAVTLLDLQGRVVDCNPATHEIAGLSREEIIGKRFLDLDILDADDLPGYAQLLSRLVSGEHVEPIEVHMTSDDRESRWLEAFPAPVVKDGEIYAIQVIARDITERKSVEESLRESDARNRALLDAQPDLMFVQSQDGTYLDYHAANEEALYVAPDQFLGQTPQRVLPEPLAGRIVDAIDEAVVSGDTQLLEYQLAVGGRLRYFEARIVPYGEKKALSVIREITEREETRKALRASHERLVTILSSMDAHVYAADMDTHEILLMNRKMQDDFGGDLRGEICWAVFRGADGPCDHCTNDSLVDDDGNPTGVHVWEARNPITDRWYINYDRAIKWVDDRVVRLQIALDVTESKQAERAIRERQRYLEGVLWAAPDAIVTLDPENRIIDWNAGAEGLFGYDRQEVMGQDIDPLITTGDMADEAAAFTELVCSGGTLLPTETVRYRKDGSPVSVIIAGAPIVVDEQLVGLVAVYTDVTARKQLERKLRQQEKLAAVGQLAGGIAHDFNNLLGSIILNAQMPLSEPELAPGTEDALETILKESRRAADLIQQILDFSRSGMMDTLPLSLGTLVQETITLLRRTIPEDIRLTAEMTSRPCVVQADATRIHQAVTNLALNARDAMPQGGELHIAVDHVVAGPGGKQLPADLPSGSWARLTVADTGTGLSREAQDHLFEPFFTTKEAGEGTGLGLAQVYGIVKQHQGFIDVQTVEGRGTTFSIFLPLVEGQDGEQTAQEEALPVGGRGETILVVEDAERLRDAIKAGLESLGYRVRTAAHGQEALEMTPTEDFDLVLTDVVMPHMGGEELLRNLQAAKLRLKVIAITGHVMDTDVEELRAIGFADALPKPFTIEELNQVVREALDG